MTTFIAKRIAAMIFVLFSISVLVFLIFFATPGVDPAARIAGRNADQLTLDDLSLAVNDLALRARENKLKPDDLSGGTYTISNVGSFGNLMGTPIIMQPQVAILAIGAIQKKPAVVETPQGDTIAIRHKMFLSHSYDHRVVDGALGGSFVRRVADYLEKFLERHPG